MSDAELQSIISSIVRRVLNENGANIVAPAPTGKQALGRVLVGICCDGCLSDAARAALGQLGQAGYALTQPDESEFKKRAVREGYIAEHDVILLPAVCYDMAAKMAQGIFDEPVALLAMSALALGKPLVATVNTHYDDGLKNNSPLLLQLFDGHRRALTKYGFNVVPPAGIGAAVAGYCGTKLEVTGKQSPANGKRQLVTAEDIGRLAKSGKLQLPAGALITPLARDRAKELGLTVE